MRFRFYIRSTTRNTDVHDAYEINGGCLFQIYFSTFSKCWCVVHALKQVEFLFVSLFKERPESEMFEMLMLDLKCDISSFFYPYSGPEKQYKKKKKEKKTK